MPLFNSYSESFEVYTKSASSNAVITTTTKDYYPLIFAKTGESCKIKGEFDLTSFFIQTGAKLVFKEQTESGTSYYAYSKNIRYKKVINGKKVNLHVHVGKTDITVGSPIIFGSY